MFEILLRIGELILGAGRIYSNRRQKRRKQEFGEMLVSIYIRLLEIISSGQEILDALSYMVQYSQDSSRDTYLNLLIKRIPRLLREQELNLKRLAVAADRIAKELYVLGTDEVIQLRFLVSSKLGLIEGLAEILGSGWIVYNISFKDGGLSKKSLEFLRLCNHSVGDSIIREEIFKRQSSIGGAELIHVGLESDQIEKARRYLETNVPEDQLKELRACARALRDLIKSNFSIDEVLWSVDRFRD